MKSRALSSVFLIGAVILVATARAQTALPKDSPFASAGGPASGSAPGETIEFVGVSSVGKRTDLVFFDKAAKKKHWVTLGETAEGISALNYDPRLEQAVVKINGTQKTLTLRKASASTAQTHATAGIPPQPASFNVPLPAPVPGQVPTVVASGAPPSVAPPVPAPAAPPQPQTPEAQAKQEQEARMLVSDLLEIGMVQRKAYEEAQRKAAEGTPPPANSASGQSTPPLTSPSGQPVAPSAPSPAQPPPGNR